MVYCKTKNPIEEPDDECEQKEADPAAAEHDGND